MFEPNDRQKALWGGWYDAATGPDDTGVWVGWCPLHTQRSERREDNLGGCFNFVKSYFECTGDPCCHNGRKKISLQNLSELITLRVTQGG